MQSPVITYDYNFTFPDGREKEFCLRLDNQLWYQNRLTTPPPTWTSLYPLQCPHCQLTEELTTHCPVALNLADLVHSFRATTSYSCCVVTCVTADRTVSKETNVQNGLSSIMGIIMATSGCPSMAILRPMARFHLPFATVDESVFRAVSAYMLRQYYIALDGGKADFNLAHITRSYKEIELVNRGILHRIRQATNLDADQNAIVILNSLAQILELEITDKLESLRPYFYPDSSPSP